MSAAQELKMAVGTTAEVSALLIRPDNARACYVFAHGAGAGMRHASMEAIAAGLFERDAVPGVDFADVEGVGRGRLAA